MKIKILLALLIAAPAMLSAAEQVKVQVKGMVCAFCAQGIQKAFKLEPGVDEVKVNLKKKLVVFTLQEGATVTDERITSLITDAGYKVGKVERGETK